MFELALKAGITFIGVSTDDPVNLAAVLEDLSGLDCRHYTSAMKIGPSLYWTMDGDLATPEVYAKFKAGEHQLVFVNTPASPLTMDCGTLPTPPTMLKDLLEQNIGLTGASLMPLLKGLSLKGVEDILRLTQARAGNTTPMEVRRTRMNMSGSIQGLYPMDTSFDFYDVPSRLAQWAGLNKAYFLTANVHPKLVPRGLLFAGPPGVGKSMASKYLSREFGVPLYRLDISTTLDKYIGVSEQRVAKILGLVDREEPCLLLIDEVEKIFNGKDDTGVTSRILSQLLWWLAEHRSRVVTIMTTNDESLLPKELYRSGRIDEVVYLHKLGVTDARNFAERVFTSILNAPPTQEQRARLYTGFTTGEFSNAEIAEYVYTTIKACNWVQAGV